MAGVFADHFLARLAAESLREVRIILQWPLNAILPGRMGVGFCQKPGAFIRAVLAPDLGKAEEETLLRRKAIFLFSGRIVLVLG